MFLYNKVIYDVLIIFCQQENGFTPLMLAAGENKLPVVDKLLELGAPINERSKVSYEEGALAGEGRGRGVYCQV